MVVSSVQAGAVLEPEVPDAPSDGGLELDPALRDAAVLGGLAQVVGHGEPAGLHAFQHSRASRSRTPSGPSTVTMFQVKAIRSRQ